VVLVFSVPGAHEQWPQLLHHSLFTVHYYEHPSHSRLFGPPIWSVFLFWSRVWGTLLMFWKAITRGDYVIEHFYRL